jgi:hypothetical protein
MRKEVVFAIFFGIAFGLVVAFGVWRLNASLSQKSGPNKTEATPSPTPSTAFGVTVAKPNDFTVFRDSQVTIEGATRNDSWIVVSGENSDNIEKAGEKGDFQIQANLTPGLNQVMVEVFDQNGESSQKSLSLIYSSQFPTPEGSSAKNSTESAQLETKVKEKVNEAVNPPIAYIGTVTDIAETTIHIKNTSDELKQVSNETDTTFSNEITKKEVKFKDLAIGDFIVAMGYKNGNQVLHAKRILVTKKPDKPSQTITFGTVKEIKNKSLTLAAKDGNVELIFPKSWKGPDIKELENGTKVIAVWVTSEGKNNIRTIQILK